MLVTAIHDVMKLDRLTAQMPKRQTGGRQAVSSHRRRMAARPVSVSDPYSRSRATPPSGKIFSRTCVAGAP